jgi:predicted regulator of Ras-like GTPase activity (Roadblock/LC7/MglB family)
VTRESLPIVDNLDATVDCLFVSAQGPTTTGSGREAAPQMKKSEWLMFAQ